MRIAVVTVLLLGFHAAHAYPQFQLSRDQTCSSCHLSPAGGELLSENGLVVAEQRSQWDTAPDAFYGAITMPRWLVIGGDVRSASGIDNEGQSSALVTFPMQAEAYVQAAFDGHFSLHVTAGARPPQAGNTASTLFGSREHWIMWKEHPDDANGWFVRLGRFLPVYGLRLVEHPDYTRRFGGTPLYGEAYGVSTDYIQSAWEAHATAFVHDPLLSDSLEMGNGAAAYAEMRLTTSTSIGVETMFVADRDDRRTFAGVTAKHYLASADLLLELEAQGIHQKVDGGGVANEFVAYALASYFVGAAGMVEVGLGYFDGNVAVKGLDRDAIDVNLHWFTTSHLELLLTSRLQLIELGAGGAASGYSLLQIHYRI